MATRLRETKLRSNNLLYNIIQEKFLQYQIIIWYWRNQKRSLSEERYIVISFHQTYGYTLLETFRSLS